MAVIEMYRDFRSMSTRVSVIQNSARVSVIQNSASCMPKTLRAILLWRLLGLVCTWYYFESTTIIVILYGELVHALNKSTEVGDVCMRVSLCFQKRQSLRRETKAEANAHLRDRWETTCTEQLDAPKNQCLLEIYERKLPLASSMAGSKPSSPEESNGCDNCECKSAVFFISIWSYFAAIRALSGNLNAILNEGVKRGHGIVANGCDNCECESVVFFISIWNYFAAIRALSWNLAKNVTAVLSGFNTRSVRSKIRTRMVDKFFFGRMARIMQQSSPLPTGDITTC